MLTPEEVDRVLEAAEAHRRLAQPDTRLLCPGSPAAGNRDQERRAAGAHSQPHRPGGPQRPDLVCALYQPADRYKERKIELTQDWIDAYQEYKSQYALEDRLFPWSPRRLEYLLEDLGEEAGLNKHLSFDMCRWTCALMDWHSGMDHNKIRQKLGISKIQWREVSMKLEKLAEALNIKNCRRVGGSFLI